MIDRAEDQILIGKSRADPTACQSMLFEIALVVLFSAVELAFGKNLDERGVTVGFRLR